MHITDRSYMSFLEKLLEVQSGSICSVYGTYTGQGKPQRTWHEKNE